MLLLLLVTAVYGAPINIIDNNDGSILPIILIVCLFCFLIIILKNKINKYK